MTEWSDTWTWLDGKWHEGNVQIMGVRSHAAWLGSSVFDGARAFEGTAPDLEAHCERVNRSAKALSLTPTMQVADIIALAKEGVAKFKKEQALYIRPMYWAEEGGFMGVPPNGDSTRFCLSLYETAMPEPSGFTATTTNFRRPSLDQAPLDAKAGCLYPNGGRAMLQAKEAGFQNAVILDAIGNVAEFATANLFTAKDGVVYTPTPNGSFLNGITRQRVIQLLRDNGQAVSEATLSTNDLHDADEIFATGNYSKVMPVTKLDQHEMQPGPITMKARELYWNFAHTKGKL